MSIIPIRQFTNELTEDDLKTKGGANDQYLQEGRYSVKVVEVSEPQPDKYDGAWWTCNLTVANDAGKISRYELYIPTSKMTTTLQGGEESNYRARDLNKLTQAIWGEAIPKDASPYIRKRFADASKLVGVKFDCTVGHSYGRSYAKKVGGAIKIFDKDGRPGAEDFASFDAVGAFVEENKIKFSKFCKVTDVHSKKSSDPI